MIIVGKFIDLTGKKYGKLTVLRRVGTKCKSPLWECICDCGNYTKVTSRDLVSGNTKSCGCISLERLIEYNHTKKKCNEYDLTGEYGIGYTSKGEEFYFDIEDYDKIKNYCWMINNNGYVSTSVRKNKKAINILMHKIIMDSSNNEDIDHINGINTRNDNRKYNLRKCSHQMNMCNYTKPKNNTSGVTGVSWDSKYLVWKAYITYQNKRINLGNFDVFDDAVRIRLLAEKKYFGDFSAQQHLYEKYNISKKAGA